MTIVVDLGCHHHSKWPSLEWLADRYQPARIYGFDPHPDTDTAITSINGIPAHIERKAAWTHDGTIAYTDQTIDTQWGEPGSRNAWQWPANFPGGQPGVLVAPVNQGDQTVECFNFSAWLETHGPAVVKMDVEGAEYALLDKLIADDNTDLVEELLVEWHDWIDTERLAHFDCPIHRWRM